jgi:sugar/nucleoside kinase (ribokinase family)
MSTTSGRIVCLGEALVDLVGERRGAELAAVECYSPHFGGVAANVALVAAIAGADVALAGGAGDDGWGRWLAARLRAAGVDLSLFELLPDTPTAIAFVTVDADGEPTYQLHGDGSATVARVLAGRAEQVVCDCAALCISTNTLAGEPERAVTMRARESALELGRPVIFDANLRLHRWRSADQAAARARPCVAGALLVRANRSEAEAMTGERDPERAAAALVQDGATMVVLTLGRGGAILRGAARADAAAVACEVISTAGAGDALTGTLLAALAAHDFSPSAVAAALPAAVAAASRACERWGSVD